MRRAASVGLGTPADEGGVGVGVGVGRVLFAGVGAASTAGVESSPALPEVVEKPVAAAAQKEKAKKAPAKRGLLVSRKPAAAAPQKVFSLLEDEDEEAGSEDVGAGEVEAEDSMDGIVAEAVTTPVQKRGRASASVEKRKVNGRDRKSVV